MALLKEASRSNFDSVLMDKWGESGIFLTSCFPYVCVSLPCRCRQDTPPLLHCSFITVYSIFSFPSSIWGSQINFLKSCQDQCSWLSCSRIERWSFYSWHRARSLLSQSPLHICPEDMTAICRVPVVMEVSRLGHELSPFKSRMSLYDRLPIIRVVVLARGNVSPFWWGGYLKLLTAN